MKKIIVGLSTLMLFAVESISVVTKVTDGDTLHVMIGNQEEKVRVLYIIDTPEKDGGSKLDKDAKKQVYPIKNKIEESYQVLTLPISP